MVVVPERKLKPSGSTELSPAQPPGTPPVANRWVWTSTRAGVTSSPDTSMCGQPDEGPGSAVIRAIFPLSI
jgi:hypothetical protein